MFHEIFKEILQDLNNPPEYTKYILSVSLISILNVNIVSRNNSLSFFESFYFWYFVP